MKKQLLLIVLALSCLLGVAWASGEYHGPHKLGPVRFDLDIWADAGPFFEQYGKGVAYEDKFPRYYYVTENKEYVYIGRYHGENRPIDTIEVSSLPSDESAYGPPEKSFGALVTEDGVGLGSRYEDVIAAYGTPDRVRRVSEMTRKPVPDSWIREYGDALLFVEYLSGEGGCDRAVFYISGGVVVSLSVSVSC